MQENKASWLITIYLILSIYLWPFPSSPKEMAIWATSVSLSEQYSFDISWARSFIKNEAVQQEEKLYSKEAPGLAILGTPIYSITRIFTGSIIKAPEESKILLSWFVLRFFLSSLPLFILAFWLYVRDADEISIAILLFASPMFVYSLLLTTYLLAGILIYFSFRLLYDPQRIFLRNCFLAGLVSGFALLCDYSTLIFLIIIAASLIVTEKQERSLCLLIFLLGILPFALFLIIYNYVLFESLLDFSIFSEVHITKIFSNLYLFLISPTYGLFFYAPIFFLSVILFFTSRERKTVRHRIKVILILVSVLLLAALPVEKESFASERFAVLLPFFMDSFFDGELYDFSNIWLGLLFFISFLFCTIPAMTFPLVTSDFRYPHNTFWLKLLIEEKFLSPTLLKFLGVEDIFLLTLPTLFLLGLAFHVVWRYVRRPERFLFGSLIGFLLVVTYLGLPNLDKNELRLKRETLKTSRFF